MFYFVSFRRFFSSIFISGVQYIYTKKLAGIGGGELSLIKKQQLISSRLSLLLSLDRFLCHLNETILGFAIGKVGNGSNGLFRVVVGKGAGLFNTITLKDEFTSL